MEWLTLLVLPAGYLLERWLGGLKLSFFASLYEKRNKADIPSSIPVVTALGALGVLGFAVFHQTRFENYSFNGWAFFLFFTLCFFLFLNSKLYATMTRAISLGKISGQSAPELDALLKQVAWFSVLSHVTAKEREERYLFSFILLSVSLYIGAVGVPIFLYLVAGFLPFVLYTLLYLLLLSGVARNRFLFSLYRGMLFLPGVAAFVVYPVTAFASGKFFLKVLTTLFGNLRELKKGYDDGIFLLNVTCVVAILEVTLEGEFKGERLVFDSGDAKLNHRVLLLTQRLFGIQKFLTYVLGIYLFMML